MASKTIKKALGDMLEDLSKQDFDKFCRQLLDRREEPRVRRNKVEDKSRLDIADVLVSAFTESGAVEVAVKLLSEIECNEDADRLVLATGGKSSKAGSSDTKSPSAGATGVSTMADDGYTGEHFVDKHRTELINRVYNVASILDELLEKKVILQGSYDEVLALPTAPAQMRKLYSGPLRAAGPDGKDVFYQILEKNEPYLIADLKKQK